MLNGHCFPGVERAYGKRLVFYGPGAGLAKWMATPTFGYLFSNYIRWSPRR